MNKMAEKMDRLYLKVVGENASVVNRSNHKLIEFLEEGQKGIDRFIELITMTKKAYYNYLLDLGIAPKEVNPLVNETSDRDKEEWFEKAWIQSTKKYMLENNIQEEIPQEEVPYDYLKEQRIKRNSKARENPKKLLKPIKEVQEEEETQEPKKRMLKPKKSKEELIEEVNKAFSNDEISVREYRTKLRELGIKPKLSRAR